MPRFIPFLDEAENLIDLIGNNVPVLILSVFHCRFSFFIRLRRVFFVLINFGPFNFLTIYAYLLIFISILRILINLSLLFQVIVGFPIEGLHDWSCIGKVSRLSNHILITIMKLIIQCWDVFHQTCRRLWMALYSVIYPQKIVCILGNVVGSLKIPFLLRSWRGTQRTRWGHTHKGIVRRGVL